MGYKQPNQQLMNSERAAPFVTFVSVLMKLIIPGMIILKTASYLTALSLCSTTHLSPLGDLLLKKLIDIILLEEMKLC